MAEVIQIIQFKRGTKENLELCLKNDNILAAGEPAYETDTKKIKVGDGISNYADLDYIGGGSSEQSIYIEGYLLNGKFYTDSTYQTECEKNNQKVYINKNSSAQAQATNFIDIYRYCGESIGFLPLVSEASDLKPGLVKLYKTHGINEDGTMTQKVITEGVNSIKFAVEQATDEDGDGEPENILVLDLPWN